MVAVGGGFVNLLSSYRRFIGLTNSKQNQAVSGFTKENQSNSRGFQQTDLLLTFPCSPKMSPQIFF